MPPVVPVSYNCHVYTTFPFLVVMNTNECITWSSCFMSQQAELKLVVRIFCSAHLIEFAHLEGRQLQSNAHSKKEL